MYKKLVLLTFLASVAALVGNASAGLQIYYPLDETEGATAEDFSGNGYDANISGSWTDVAVFGGALDLSGDGYIDVTGFTPGAGMTDFTFMAWMRNDDWPGYAGIWSNGESLRISGGLENEGMVEIVFRGEPPLEQWYVPYPVNEWIHVAVVRSGTSIKLYWRGEYKGERTLVENPDYTVFQIGNSSQNEPMNAIFDEVGIWDEALDFTTITDYMNSGIPGAITYTATNPSPARNAENVCPGATLTWTAGDLAEEHDVYFGADYNSVRDANTVVQLGVYVDRRGTTSYAPSLDMGV
ncbi:MAG TPA: LamG domain-containing protein [Sedimentisphaerales bacterium]|nr:LamG domain-containing protein [Sedimentisphaerales bacterium]